AGIRHGVARSRLLSITRGMARRCRCTADDYGPGKPARGQPALGALDPKPLSLSRSAKSYGLPVKARYGRVIWEGYHVWGMDECLDTLFAANRGRLSCGAWPEAKAGGCASGF